MKLNDWRYHIGIFVGGTIMFGYTKGINPLIMLFISLVLIIGVDEITTRESKK